MKRPREKSEAVNQTDNTMAKQKKGHGQTIQWAREKGHGQTIIQNTAQKTKEGVALKNPGFSEGRVA